MHGEAAPCDIAGSRVVILPSLHAAPCRFTVHTPRPTAESPDLSDFRGSHSRFCHLCTLHRADSPFTLSSQTHFAISAGFTVQVHRPHPSPDYRIARPWRLWRLALTILPSLHAASCRFQISDFRFRLQQFDTRGEASESADFTVQLHAPRIRHRRDGAEPD